MRGGKGHRRIVFACGAAALAAASIAGWSPVRAEEGWQPVIVAAAPANEPMRAAERPAAKSRSKPANKQVATVPPRQLSLIDKPSLVAVSGQTASTVASAPAVAAPAATADGHGRAASAAFEPDARIAHDYCTNIADAAADARFAWQKKALADVEQEIAKRVALLEEKMAEYQKWLARRDEFSKKAHDSVVTIYARMRPDAAAAQLVAMDEETAAAVLTKLDPRNAGAILNEMDAAQAARLTATISGAANVNLPGRPKAQAGEKKS